MRLINVKTLKFEEFHHDIPPYAILSHTWGHEEVTFQDYLLVIDPYSNPNTHIRVSAIKKKAGYAKIMDACRRADEDKLGYLWCDTNCIDKRSSAELTEAINSMYAWYYNSAICYAYLTDVAVFDTTNRDAEEFRNSRWFTRGWTLQELIAPKEVLFFNRGWEPIATRRYLAEIIRGVTRIHIDALLDRNTIQDYSVAQRMSWAADRQTSRREDIAYCLLGIFDINMPLLYGEGIKAFTRLQEEIIKVSDDQSILAWDFLSRQQQLPMGVLASSPHSFAHCGSIVRETGFIPRPYSMTNVGISIQLPTIRTVVKETILVRLNCSVELRAHSYHRDARDARFHCRRFPVWIWLRIIGLDVYTRSPIPVSRTSLTSLYPDGIHCVTTKLFAITSASRTESWVSSLFSSIHSNSPTSTGFHVTISFGRIRPRTSTFEATFRADNYTVYQIPPRGTPAVSHEIVSAGNYIVLLSIAWDNTQEPIERRHDIFMDMGGRTIRVMSANNWNLLFETKPKSGDGRDRNVRRLNYIHDEVRRLSHQPRTAPDQNAQPFVEMEKDLWQDHHGQAKVVAHLTFQEETRPR